MTHVKRPKVIKAKLEKELERYSKRIQKLASKAYQIRTMLEDLAMMEQSVQGGQESALHPTSAEGSPTGWAADPNARQPDVSDSIVAAAVLAEQPTELRNDLGDAGKSAGSGI